ncbi:hypothetical protein RD792_013705 [Penstemon davidsonii]|uniref:RING-type E3 ubiquitin transferase n=1 Tax=Penstemon davidsonii TaxID=160366 RepID=A0ABR0CU74_9LAMI|nr:hypothetical protein RD792_013705 [Penstemon davidsonii]
MIMEERITNKIEGLNELPPPAYSIVAVAISGSTKSKYIVKWALDKFIPEGQVYFKILHVRPVISGIPTPMGNYIPISQVRDDVEAAFRKEVEWQVTEKLLPYKKMCIQRKVEVEVVQIESDDVQTAIAGEIRKYKINKLVIGASSRSIFSRGHTLSLKISEICPNFCTVYAVTKGKLSSMRPSDSETNSSSIRDDTSCSTDNSSSYTSCSRTEWTEQGSEGSNSHFRSASLPAQRFQALSTLNQTLLDKRMPSSGIMHPRNFSLDFSDVDYKSSQASSFRSSDQPSISDTSSDNQANVNFELEKLRIELRHVRGMYAMAQGEAIDASREKCRLEEEIKLKQISFQEEEAKELARKEKERYKATKLEADFVKECAEREVAERKEAEDRASNETKEKESLESALAGCFHHYRKFTWEEIVFATSSFSENLKIGMGAYGTVYKCSFHHTTAAVKVLHDKESRSVKQFQQELEILSQIRHPHLLILLGACPDHSCLVYEFMENGSLEDRLLKKNNTPPILWFHRYRIAWEIASVLVYLHNSRPKGIIHRDLKPANILLDRNYVSKIGDIGLSTMLNNNDSLSISTALAGTLCYIDPEYQRTGLVSPMSDVYAYGIVVLQLLTGKSAMGISRIVEIAMINDRLMEVLDYEAGSWPIEETKRLAYMALRCTELRRRDRPGLVDEVL